MSIYLDLFLSFAKVGVLTFGGGYAMLPILEREIVDRHGWASNNELLDYYAVGQCTPGVIAVNTATFIGKKKAGVAGGIVATLGVVSPSLIIILLISSFLRSFSDNPYVKSAFAGIRVCVCVLIFNSVLKLWKSAVKDKIAIILFLIALAVSLFLDISPVIIVLCAAAAGVAISAFRNGRGAEK